MKRASRHSRDLPDAACEPRPIQRIEQRSLRRRHQDVGPEHVRLLKPEEAAVWNVREEVPGAANRDGPLARSAREVDLGKDLLGQPVMGAGGGERVEVRGDEQRARRERVRVADALASAIGGDELEEARTDALEPALLDESVREEASVAVGAAQPLAQLGGGDGLLAAPFEVEDDFRLVLGESAFGFNHDDTFE
jgi:hypothetical protein